MSKKWSRGKREAVWGRSDGQCWYCGKHLILPENNPESMEKIASWFVVDHLIPKTHGGDNFIMNLVPACWICNSQKGHKSLEEYRLYLSMKDAGFPYFTQEQIAWLLEQGFRVPDVQPILFWFELPRVSTPEHEETRT